jgi:hypothetical protein
MKQSPRPGLPSLIERDRFKQEVAALIMAQLSGAVVDLARAQGHDLDSRPVLDLFDRCAELSVFGAKRLIHHCNSDGRASS